jgi:hypothetical protein
MISQDLFELLNKNPEKVLRFEYQTNQYVNPNFHITEVKNVQINSVDCGGRRDSWNETVLQLWNPSSEAERYPMNAAKALSILNKVDEVEPIDKNSILYFEYGNNEIPVSNYSVADIIVTEDLITFQFNGLTTQCKPSVNSTGSSSSCCSPSEESNASSSSCCAPETLSTEKTTCCA